MRSPIYFTNVVTGNVSSSLGREAVPPPTAAGFLDVPGAKLQRLVPASPLAAPAKARDAGMPSTVTVTVTIVAGDRMTNACRSTNRECWGFRVSGRDLVKAGWLWPGVIPVVDPVRRAQPPQSSRLRITDDTDGAPKTSSDSARFMPDSRCERLILTGRREHTISERPGYAILLLRLIFLRRSHVSDR